MCNRVTVWLDLEQNPSVPLPKMREIIYIQAGNLSNHIGTHFWNTQQTYCTDDDLAKDSLVCKDISFTERFDAKGSPALCPRLLIFDTKSNFGTLLLNDDTLGQEDDVRNSEGVKWTWSGDVIEYRHNPIPVNPSQAHMDESSDDRELSSSSNNRLEYQSIQDIGEARYWSDYNQIHHLPRSINKIPDPMEWETFEGDWQGNQSIYSRYNKDVDVLDGSFREFAEECDHLQGIQVMNDVDTFGGFMKAFLTCFRDEFPKLPSLTFPLLSASASRNIDVDDHLGTRVYMNDALYLRSLNELSTLNIPIRTPVSWSSDAFRRLRDFENSSVYHQSAVLSTHIETATLPLRLGADQDLASVSAKLNWRGVSRFGELCGVFPFTTLPIKDTLFNFSASYDERDSHQFARLDVTRGFTSTSLSAYQSWCNDIHLPERYVSSVHGCPFPITKSFPPILQQFGGNNKPFRPYYSNKIEPTPTSEVFSSVVATSNTSELFRNKAIFIEKCVKTRNPAMQAIGINLDDLKELASDLWTIYDDYSE